MKCCLKNIVNFILFLAVLFIAFQVMYLWYLQPLAVEKISDHIKQDYQFSDDGAVVIKKSHPPYKLPDGKFGMFTARADKANIEGMEIEDFLLHIEGCQIDVWKALISGDVEFIAIGDTNLSFKASQEAIASRWSGELKKKRLTNVSLELADGKAKVRAEVDLEFTTLPISATGTIEATEDGQVLFKAVEVGLGEAELDVSGVKSAFKTLSPIFDAGQMDLQLYVNDVTIENGYLEVEASSYVENGQPTPDSPTEKGAEAGPAETGGQGALEGDAQTNFLDRLKLIAGKDEEQRREELGKLYEEMKSQGVKSQEQVSEYVAEQAKGLKDEYKWLLKELNRLVESQIENLDEEEGSSEDEENPENSDGG